MFPCSMMGALLAPRKRPVLLPLFITPSHHIHSPQAASSCLLTAAVQDTSNSLAAHQSLPTLQASFYPQISDHLQSCWKPLSGAPWGSNPQRPALAPLFPLAHIPIGSSLNTPGCFTPTCRGRLSSPCLHGLLNSAHSSDPCLVSFLPCSFKLPGPSSLEQAPLSPPLLH